MPTVPSETGDTCAFLHLPHPEWPLFNACVARILGKREIARRKDAQEALKLEGDAVAVNEVWLRNGVRENSGVVQSCKSSGKKAQFADIFGTRMEK